MESTGTPVPGLLSSSVELSNVRLKEFYYIQNISNYQTWANNLIVFRNSFLSKTQTTLNEREGGSIIPNNKALRTTVSLSKIRNMDELYHVTLKSICQEVTKY